MNAQNWRFDSQIMQHDIWCSIEKWQPTHMVNTWIAFCPRPTTKQTLSLLELLFLSSYLLLPAWIYLPQTLEPLSVLLRFMKYRTIIFCFLTR